MVLPPSKELTAYTPRSVFPPILQQQKKPKRFSSLLMAERWITITWILCQVTTTWTRRPRPAMPHSRTISSALGFSDHPDPVQVVQLPIQIGIALILLREVRSGEFGGRSFKKIVGVGHSFGSAVTQAAAPKYLKNLDALILQEILTLLHLCIHGRCIRRHADCQHGLFQPIQRSGNRLLPTNLSPAGDPTQLLSIPRLRPAE